MIYHAYTSNNQYTCDQATNSDTCYLHCNEQKSNGLDLNCGNAGTCYLYCSQLQALNGGTLNATNTDNLLVISNGQFCLRNADIYLPNDGNAAFSTSAEEGFEDVNIHSGKNTQNIIINCADSSIYPQSCMQIDGM